MINMLLVIRAVDGPKRIANTRNYCNYKHARKRCDGYRKTICLSSAFFPAVSLFVCPEVNSVRLSPKMEMDVVKTRFPAKIKAEDVTLW